MSRGVCPRERGGERGRHHRRRRRCRGGQLKSKSSQQCKFITGLSKSTALKKASEECSGLHLWLPSGIRGRACSQHLQPSEPYAISAAIAHTWTRPNPTNVDQTLAAGRSNSTRSKVRLARLVVSLYKQLEPFADVAGLAIGDPAGQRFSSTEQQYTTITTIGHEC